MAPTTRRALRVKAPGQPEITDDVPIPSLQDGEILVKVHAVALNPTDWHHLDFLAAPGTILGCDYAGVVEEVGTGITNGLKKGDRVAGFTHGGNTVNPSTGAFASYIIAKGNVQAKIPPSLSYTDASTLGVGISTIAQALYQHLSLPLPGTTSSSGSSRPFILINGGSTATGTLAIQFATLSGARVITTCSPKHFSHVKSLGAEVAIDYKSATASADISAAADGGLTMAFDCVSEGDSGKLCVDALSKKGGQYIHLKPVENLPRGEAEGVKESMPVAYKTLGEDFKYGDWPIAREPEVYEFGVKFWAIAHDLLEEGKIRTHPVKVLEGGLEGVPGGLDLLRQKKVSGEKVVFTLVD